MPGMECLLYRRKWLRSTLREVNKDIKRLNRRRQARCKHIYKTHSRAVWEYGELVMVRKEYCTKCRKPKE